MKNYLKLAAFLLCVCALLGFAASRLQAEGGRHMGGPGVVADEKRGAGKQGFYVGK